MNLPRKLPSRCPSCDNTLKISELVCKSCGTKVSGCFDMPIFLHLTAEEQKFIIDFVKESGSLKEMSAKLKLSYPTVRNILDAIIDKISSLERNAK